MWYENEKNGKCRDLRNDLDYARSEYDRLCSELSDVSEEMYCLKKRNRDEVDRIMSSHCDEIAEYEAVIFQKDQYILQKNQEIETLKQKILDQEKRIHLLSYNRKIV